MESPELEQGLCGAPLAALCSPVVLCLVISSCGFWKPSVLLPLLALVAQ